MMKKTILALAALLLAMMLPGMARAEDAATPENEASAPMESDLPVNITSPAAILTEASTGRVIFEKNADERRPVASVTKAMTILLTMEAIDGGRIGADDKVTVSEHAAGMGGSQAFLDAGGVYKVRELLKSVIVASANDSAVALAEYIDGSEGAFAARMNARAKELGLTNTHYANCTGLPASEHYMSARDVAVLSAQLDRHPMYYEFSGIWMDEIEHKGGRVTQLTNTNRLIRFYPGCDGYKTGSTNEARYCISATAKKDGMRLIAVVLGSGASQTRFDEARAMLEYGFAGYRLMTPVKTGDDLGADVPVKLGSRDAVRAVSGGTCSMLMRRGQEGEISLEVALAEQLAAPVAKGAKIGEVRVLRGGEQVAVIDAVAGEDVPLPGMLSALMRIRDRFMIRMDWAKGD